MSNPKSKTQKKLDNRIREVLTNACEQLLEQVPGFAWLTHQADYANFPASLLITCVFDDEEALQQAHIRTDTRAAQKRIQSLLLTVGVVLKNIDQQIIFDNEQACASEHDGNWARRLATRAGRAVPRGRPLH